MYAVRVLDNIEHKCTFPKIPSHCLMCQDLSMDNLSVFKHSFRNLLMSITTFFSMTPRYIPLVLRCCSNFFTSWSTKTSLFQTCPHLVSSLDEELITQAALKGCHKLPLSPIAPRLEIAKLVQRSFKSWTVPFPTMASSRLQVFKQAKNSLSRRSCSIAIPQIVKRGKSLAESSTLQLEA